MNTENDDYLGALKDSLNESSKYNRRIISATLLIVFYLLITVASTTDLQLLMPDSKIKLPLINTDIPLLYFYVVTPLLIICFHYYLLFNLLGHSRKLNKWTIKTQEYEDSLLLNPFLLNYLTARYRDNIDCYLNRIMIWFVLFLPLLTITFIQIRFSSYQSLTMTVYHFLNFVIDSFLIFIYAYRITNLDASKNEGFKTIFDNTMKALLSHPFRNLLRNISLTVIVACAISNLLLLILIFNNISPIDHLQGLFKFFKIQGVFEYKHKSIYGMLVPHLDVSGEILVSSPPSDNVLQAYLASGKTKNDAFEDFAAGLILRDRDLRFANFNNSILRKVNLNGANLQRASFEGSQLQQSNMGGAQLQRARFHWAKLQGAFFGGANLRRASFMASELNGADLSSAQLQGARLYGADLSGANLSNAKLQGASLLRSALIGADLSNAQLQGTHLGAAYLYGAYIASGNLRGASLAEAQLQGASLEGASLEGAYLDRVKLRGANLNNANTEGVIFESVDTKSDVNWDQLLRLGESHIPEQPPSEHFYPKEYFKRRIEEAKKRDKSINDKYRSVLRSDPHKFLGVRQQLACEDIYIADGIFDQGFGDEKTSNIIKKSIYEYMIIHCPDSLKKVKSLGQVNLSFLK